MGSLHPILKKTKKPVIDAMKSSKGRIFGLTLTDGSQINARFIKETPLTITIYDNNLKRGKRLNKNKFNSIRMGSVQIG